MRWRRLHQQVGKQAEIDFDISEQGPNLIMVSGGLDMATTPALRNHLSQAEVAGTGDLIIDMSGLTFMDSTGLGALVAASRRMALEGRSIILRSPQEAILQVLRFTRLETLFVVEA